MEEGYTVWSDDTKMSCLGLDECKSAWKKVGEGLGYRVVERIAKFDGGSVMMWDCITWQEV